MLKPRKKTLWYHEPIILFLIVLAVFMMLRGMYSSLMKRHKASQELKVYQEEFNKLDQQHTSYLEKIEELKTSRGREEVYRENYNARLPGEKIIRVVE